MANRIKGITIEIAGDSKKLTDSLAKVDKSLQDTQSQLRDVNKLLKLDPSNIELLRQKHDLLGKAVTDTKKRQEELKAALEQSKNAGNTEENRRQQDLLQRELIETTEKLKDLEKEYKNSSPTLQAISAKTGALAEQTKGLSTAAGLAAGGMVAMAVSAGKTADALKTDAQVTGFSVEELQKLKYATDLVDVSYDTMIGSVQKLTKQMSSGNKAFEKLGVAIKNEDGSMRSATDVWYDALAALGQVENETERDALSMELFGKSAMEMAGIVDDGGEKLKALGEEAEQAGLIMSADAVNGAGKFNDALDKLKATAVQSFAEAGATLADTLVPMLEKLVEVVSKVLAWFGNLDGTTQTVILTVLALVAAISPVLGLISTITAALPALSAAMTAITGPIGLIIAGVAAVIAIGVALYKNWDIIKEKAQTLWANIKETFERIKTAIVTPIQDAVEKVKGFIQKIKDFFNFHVSLPHINLPHFAISPQGWKLGDLLKGSIPKLSIEWYAKAMEGGVMFDSPTVIPTLDGLKGFGEAGREIVIGQNSLLKMIEKSMQNAGTGDINVSVTVNGSVDDPKLFAREIASDVAQEIQAEMARQGRAFA